MVVVVAILLADLVIVSRRSHEPTMRESGLWVGFYVGLALLFALAMLVFAGGDASGQFLAGWLTDQGYDCSRTGTSKGFRVLEVSPRA